MSFVDILGGINCGLVFFFGAALSVAVAGGCATKRMWIILFSLCPIFLALQTASWLMWGLDATKRLYPLLVHLPLLLVLVFTLKKPLAVSLVSICAAYLCCQLPRCGAVIVTAITVSSLLGQIVYSLIIVPIFCFLLRYFVPSARDTIAESPRALFLFGCLPVLYYIYDYTIALYSNLLYAEILSPTPTYSAGKVVSELLPPVVGLLYMLYTTAYRQQLLRQTQAEMQSSLTATQLRQAEVEMASLRRAEAQSAAYQHDMRHHLTAIDAFLAAGKPQQAQEYIKQVRSDIEAITPRRFCENELVNLLCSSFSARAERMGIRFTPDSSLPGELSIPDTELCALLSNGLENAFNAVESMSGNRRWVELYCDVRVGKVLIEIKNPYSGPISFCQGLPITARANHGHGCRSIQAIARSHEGICEFKAEGGVFTLRVVLPM